MSDLSKTGLCMTVLYIVPSVKAREYLPPNVEVIEVLPGMTIGGIYAARFPQGGDALNEFGVMPAYVRYESRKGYFLHNCFVDRCGGTENESVQSGPAAVEPDIVWEFDGNRVSLDVSYGGEDVIKVQMTPRVKRLPISSCFHFLCVKGGNVVFFKNRIASNIGLSTTTVTIPESSPLAGFPLKYKLVSTYWEASNVVKREAEYAPSRILKTSDEAFGSHMTHSRAVQKREPELCGR